MMIKRISENTPLPENLRNAVVAIGNFDGVHRGHQSVLEKALEISKANDVPAIVMTFEPHPRAIFQPDNAPFRISPAPMKASILGRLGFQAVVEQEFDREFASQAAQDYVDNVLKERLGVSHVVTGFDFHFGRGREGGPAFLMKAGHAAGFGVTLVDAFRDENAEVISSSRIRKLLRSGEITEAAGLLGYHFTVSGKISKGKQLGRTLGYPTANMILPIDGEIKLGVYAVRFKDQSGACFDGVASLGVRPTVEADGAPILETFLFDFEGDLYDQICEVSLISYLRGEKRFESLDVLVAQMKVDEEEARAVLSNLKPLSHLDQLMCFYDEE